MRPWVRPVLGYVRLSKNKVPLVAQVAGEELQVVVSEKYLCPNEEF